VPDVLALSAVVGAALPASFTFLYQRLHHLLDARGGSPETAPEVPPALVGTLQLPLQVQLEDIEERRGELEGLRDALSVYARGAAPVDVGDAALLRMLGRLRGTLEELYGQRLTFTGEQRPASGSPFVRQKQETVVGEVYGMEAQESITGGTVVQETTTVEKDGKLVGMKARRIGTPGTPS
jgi:hypothetical protein